jgi:small multidrug resistance family-3 protein
LLTIVAYAGAALGEIAGCFAFWAWLRLHRSMLWTLPGIAALAVFAMLLTLVDSDAAGRTFAAYGGIYVASAILWLWIVEGNAPTRFDLIGAAVCLLGTGIILLGPKFSGAAVSR